MDTGKNPSDNWPTEPSVSASGGHLSPEPPAAPGLFETLEQPIPDPQRSQPTQTQPRTRERTRRPSRRRSSPRRVRRVLRHVDPMSVLKVSLFYYACFLVVWLIVVAIMYAIANSLGLFDAIEDVAEAFVFSWRNEITLFLVERWAFVIGLVFLIVASLLNVFLAFLYNVVSDFSGGVEMTFIERDI